MRNTLASWGGSRCRVGRGAASADQHRHPIQQHLPQVWPSSPVTRLNVVVLPAPLGPSKPTTSPGWKLQAHVIHKGRPARVSATPSTTRLMAGRRPKRIRPDQIARVSRLGSWPCLQCRGQPPAGFCRASTLLAEHLLAAERFRLDALVVHPVVDALGPDRMAVALDHVHIAAEDHQTLLAEILGLAGCRHNPLVGVDDANVACGGDHAGAVVGLLQVGFNRDQTGGWGFGGWRRCRGCPRRRLRLGNACLGNGWLQTVCWRPF